KRSGDSTHPKEWACPGGHIEDGETPEQAALREFSEECGSSYDGELTQLYHTQDASIDFTTYLAHVEEFAPTLNAEHTAFMWCDLDDLPNKLHPAVRAMLEQDAVKGAILGESLSDAEYERKYDVERADCSVFADSEFKEGD